MHGTRILLGSAAVLLGACSSSTSSSPTSESSSSTGAASTSSVSDTTATVVPTSTAGPTSVPPTTVAPTTASPTTVPATTVLPTTVPASVPPPTTAAGAAPCAVAGLALVVGEGDGAAGSIYTPLVFTNTGGTACTLDGHPGVSFVDGAGNQIGPSAERTTGPTPTVTLAPGAHAHATLQTHDAGFYGDECVSVQAARLKVYPPDETSAITVDYGFAVCTGVIVGPQFVIDVVQPRAAA